ncbi:DUF2189 domain-containing protein [Methylopila henanensis]|uniref:DUF2189 domain-containing protein n=1 Tax=Methylopila henanensis TaxID=873516 RepID=A0ABW4K5K1_9HYPH
MSDIRNPAQWTVDGLGRSGQAIAAARRALTRPEADYDAVEPQVRRIGFRDLGAALREGFDDFAACRSDVLFIGLIYPLAGLALYHAATRMELLPLLFPITAGFALVGPFLAIGLYEMSRRREAGEEPSFADATRVFASPSTGAILTLGALLVGVFALWLAVAWVIYAITLGPDLPASFAQFVDDVLHTYEGARLIVLGCSAGFVFALGVLAASVVSFPLLLDRKVRVRTAVATSLRAFQASPGPMLAWGLIVALGLVLGSLPALLGLIVVMPVLGHATWRLYRRAVV